MDCPVCGEDHTSRPIPCLQAASLSHVGTCGISTEHYAEDCLLKLLNEYVDSKPEWQRKRRRRGS